jgi:hypothetical protein
MHTTRRAKVAAALALVAAFACALLAPIPTTTDAGLADVMGRLQTRLPGWEIERAKPSWEGAYSVVASCAGRQIGFQFVPGHGLPLDDAWLQPSNGYAREQLTRLSDHWRYLIWRDDPVLAITLPCSPQVALDGGDTRPVIPD